MRDIKLPPATTAKAIRERLSRVDAEIKGLREVERQRRIKAGAQLKSDYDHSAKWIGELPTFNATSPARKSSDSRI